MIMSLIIDRSLKSHTYSLNNSKTQLLNAKWLVEPQQFIYPAGANKSSPFN